jgi:hypothetical protein
MAENCTYHHSYCGNKFSIGTTHATSSDRLVILPAGFLPFGFTKIIGERLIALLVNQPMANTWKPCSMPG